jgi:hypothetical protein
MFENMKVSFDNSDGVLNRGVSLIVGWRKLRFFRKLSTYIFNMNKMDIDDEQ